MARKFKDTRESGKTILLVDDSRDYLDATSRVLEREGHSVICADSGAEALYILKTTQVDLLLLDYYMPGMTGEQVLTELRKFDTRLQVILQTGYASENPPRELLRKLDIQGYFDKSEGPEKLLLWTDVGLKAAWSIQLLEKSRRGLDYILTATPDLYKIQPISDLLHGILWQVSGLLGSSNSFLAVMPPNENGKAGPDGGAAIDGSAVRTQEEIESELQGFLVMLDGDQGALRIHAGVGKFCAGENLEEAVGPVTRKLLSDTLARGEFRTGDGVTLIPLRVGASTVGIIYLENAMENPTDIELLKVFANQAAVAIHNSQLYQMATIDPLTGVFVRRFFSQWIIRELKNASRTHEPLGLVMIDLDNMKTINDTAGHLAGDQALVELVAALKDSSRNSDYIGRFGGDEFSVLLPNTSREGVELVAQRILESVRSHQAGKEGSRIQLRASLGSAVLLPPETATDFLSHEYWHRLSRTLLNEADRSLYEAKHAGRDRAGAIHSVRWPDSESISS